MHCIEIYARCLCSVKHWRRIHRSKHLLVSFYVAVLSMIVNVIMVVEHSCYTLSRGVFVEKLEVPRRSHFDRDELVGARILNFRRTLKNPSSSKYPAPFTTACFITISCVCCVKPQTLFLLWSHSWFTITSTIANHGIVRCSTFVVRLVEMLTNPFSRNVMNIVMSSLRWGRRGKAVAWIVIFVLAFFTVLV